MLPPPNVLVPKTPKVGLRPARGRTQQALDTLAKRDDLTRENAIAEGVRIRTARALEANPARLRLFQRENVTFKVLDGPKSYVDGEGVEYLEVLVHAEKDDMDLPLENPYRWYAPHVEVHDGTFTKEPLLDSDGDPVLDVDGDPMYEFVPNYVEDPETALKDQIAAAVFHVARDRGWNG